MIRMESKEDSRPDGRIYVEIPPKDIGEMLKDCASGRYRSMVIDSLEAAEIVRRLKEETP